MKQLIGDANKIDETIIGKIVKGNGLYISKSNKILVTEDGSKSKGFAALITSSSLNPNVKGIFNIDEISELNYGDIVTLDRHGIINVVHEVNSLHNALFITGRCNSRCVMCPQPPVKEENDRHTLNLKHIDLLPRETISIGITGGEPTLIGEKLFTIIKKIKTRLPKTKINILSNAIKFENLDYVKGFIKAINKNTIIEIPLYSDIDEIHNEIVGSKTFYRTIKGIYNLAKFNV
ncbi:MAG: radical SAM protein, partial [bacterium]